MKIAILSDFCTPFTTGGIERRYYDLAQYLISRGHNVTWYTSKQWQGKSELLIDNIKIKSVSGRFQTYTGDRYSGSRRSIIQALIFGFWSVKLLLIKNKYDLLEISEYPFFHLYVGGIYEKLRKTPVIYSWYEYWGDHWNEYLGGMKGVIGKIVENYFSLNSKKKIVISQQLFRNLTSLGNPPNTLYYVPNWIDYKEITDADPIGKPYDICYFGRLKNHKNIDKLIEAIAILKNSGLELKTKILGQGPEKKALIKLVEKLDLVGSVKIYGRIEEHKTLIGYVKQANLCINLSTKEGGGSITCVEANACGVPVLAVDHPLGLDKSLISEGSNGYWVDNTDPIMIAKKIESHFLDKNDLKEEIKIKCKNWARSFDKQILCKKIESVYFNVINDNKHE